MHLHGQVSISYEHAYIELQAMLQNRKPISFENAVFQTEKAYCSDSLDRENWNNQIYNLENLARSKAESRTLLYEGKDKDKLSLHAGIFSVMTDTISIPTNEGMVYNLPFRYDFSDIWGHSDWTKMFVSKLLDTGTGNCHSLPYLYKILAERLGIRAWLSSAPNHLYIKNYCEGYGWYNTELTSGIFPIDAWLMASGYVHLDAVKNGVYMDTLSEKESIALCLVDLAQGYERRIGTGDGEFVQKCCSLALDYYPECINAMLLLAESLRKQVQANPSSPQSTENESPDQVFAKLEALYAKIHRFGYRRMPEGMYSDWLASLTAEKAKFENAAARKSQFQTR
jgi:hypothetical protein